MSHGFVYLDEGRYGDAAFSFVAAVPFIGSPAAQGTKHGWRWVKKFFGFGKYAPNPNAIKSASHGVAMGAAAARKTPPAKPIAAPGCFLAGTLVLTGAGPTTCRVN